MKLKITKTILLLLCIFTQGCTVLIEDISKNKEYESVINKTYETRMKFIIHGVTNNRTSEKAVHYYTVTPPAGIGGPEIVNKTPLEVSTKIKIIKVLKCTNCYLHFPPRIKFQVEVLSNNSFDDHDVFFRGSWGDMKFLYVENDTAVINPEYFTLID
jgi:hypothetical protein